jgi:hypothetical protein
MIKYSLEKIGHECAKWIDVRILANYKRLWGHWWTSGFRNNRESYDELNNYVHQGNFYTTESIIFRPTSLNKQKFLKALRYIDRLCGLVVRVSGYRSRGPGLDSRRFQILWEAVGLGRGPLSLVRTTEELLGRNSSGSGLENRDYDRGDPLRW